MLLHLTGDQVSMYWDTIAKAIESSMPPYTYSSSMKLNRVFQELLSERMQAWIVMSDAEGNGSIEALGVMITAIQEDQYTDTKNLLIYTLYGIQKITEEVWKEGLATLIKFARTKDCFRIIAYTDIPAIMDRVEELGGDVSISFVSLEV